MLDERPRRLRQQNLIELNGVVVACSLGEEQQEV